VKWSDGGTEATRTITVTDNVTLTAEFAINVYTVALSAENGTVTGSGEYEHGQTANISAVPSEGYHFVNWTRNGEEVSTEATAAIAVAPLAATELIAEYVANFAQD
jgi:hypothetical protein